ncbi:MAG: EVE domain-containing protein [Candidatus Cyclobacteriaceae bacterium M3_2C_046]
MNYWLVKTEPQTYSWQKFSELGKDHWDGVRNYQARNHLTNMKLNDLVLFYHSGKRKEVVGLARVVKESFPDPTADDPAWVAVDLAVETALKQPVSLKQIKQHDRLQDMYLIRNSRLSVMPVKREAFGIIMSLSENNPAS